MQRFFSTSHISFYCIWAASLPHACGFLSAWRDSTNPPVPANEDARSLFGCFACPLITLTRIHTATLTLAVIGAHTLLWCARSYAVCASLIPTRLWLFFPYRRQTKPPAHPPAALPVAFVEPPTVRFGATTCVFYCVIVVHVHHYDAMNE